MQNRPLPLNFHRPRHHSPFSFSHSGYTIRLAETIPEIDEVLQLRFKVFNLEMDRGLKSSFETQRDWDQFDTQCDHLIAICESTQQIIGTYRLQTHEIAEKGNGFYTGQEFDLSDIPLDVLSHCVEMGRVCVAAHHRNGKVPLLLWKGIARYLSHHQKWGLLGCCSLPSVLQSDAQKAMDYFKDNDHFHSSIHVKAFPKYQARSTSDDTPNPESSFKLPGLVSMYLRYGAQICSEPAFDFEFKTIDFMAIFDYRNLNEKHYNLFFK